MLLRSFESFEKTENGYLIHGDAADVKLIFMTDDIIRIRVHPAQGREHPHHRAGCPLRRGR